MEFLASRSVMEWCFYKWVPVLLSPPTVTCTYVYEDTHAQCLQLFAKERSRINMDKNNVGFRFFQSSAVWCTFVKPSMAFTLLTRVQVKMIKILDSFRTALLELSYDFAERFCTICMWSALSPSGPHTDSMTWVHLYYIEPQSCVLF